MLPLKDSARLVLLVLAAASLQITAAITAPMLAGEAYYWLWNRYPAAGYFDHPPMVAFMAKLFFGGVDGSPLAARSSSIVLAALTVLLVYALARAMVPGGRTAWRTALLFAVTPLFHAGGAMIQPDTSLLFFMTLTWLSFWKASRPGGRPGWWLLSGLAAGGALLTKFHAWVLLPPLYLFLLLTPEGRLRLRSPWPWLAIAIALALLSPNLVWNYRHDWLNYTYQWRRSDLPESTFELGNVLVYILGPALTLSPLVYLLLLGGVARGLRQWLDARDPRALFLLCAGLPLPLFLGLLSFAVTISLHWPSSGYVPLMVLAVALLDEGRLFRPSFYRIALASALLMTGLAHAAIHSVNLIPPGLRSPVRGDMINTTRLKAEWHGWEDIGRFARGMLDEAGTIAPTVLMARDWHLASSLAFYSRHPKQTFAYRKADAHNFELWMRERGMLKGVNAIVFIQKSDPYEKHSRFSKKVDEYVRELTPLFETVLPRPSLILYTDGEVERYWGVDTTRPRYREFIILECRGFRGRLLE